nr:unnamed protein product [Digitaria exilis]
MIRRTQDIPRGGAAMGGGRPPLQELTPRPTPRAKAKGGPPPRHDRDENETTASMSSRLDVLSSMAPHTDTDIAGSGVACSVPVPRVSSRSPMVACRGWLADATGRPPSRHQCGHMPGTTHPRLAIMGMDGLTYHGLTQL